MAVWGADAEELDRLAASLAAYSRLLEQHRSSLNARLHHAPWEGPEADRFRSDWDRRHSRMLLSASQALAEAQVTLRRNADQQRQASEAAFSGSFAAGAGRSAGLPLLPSAMLGGLGTLMRWGGRALEPVSVVDDQLEKLSANRMVTGRYSKSWDSLIAWGDKHGLPEDMLRFKRSEFTHLVHPYHAYFKVVGKGLTGLGYVVSTATVYSDLRDRHFVDATLDTGSEVAGFVKSRGGPVGYLGGAAIQTWVNVGKAAQTVDWSPQGLQQIQHASLSDWEYGVTYAVKKLPGELWSIFSP